MKNSIMKKGGGIIFVLVFCSYLFILLAAAELVLIVFKPAPLFYEIDVVFDEGNFMLSPDRKLIYTPKPNTGEFNEYGYRGKVFPFKKGQAGRIVFMGDSATEGIFVPSASRFTDILNDKLKGEYEVVNLAVAGYNLSQEAEYFKIFGSRFNPDYVYFGVCGNDLTTVSNQLIDLDAIVRKKKNSFYAQYYNVKSKLDGALSSLNLYRYIKYFVSQNTNKGIIDSYSLTLDEIEVKGIIQDLKTSAERQKIKMVFVFLPQNRKGQESEQMALLERVINSMNIEYLDLDKYFDTPGKQKYKSTILFDNWHFNQKGHKVVGKMLYDYIKKQSITIDTPF